ncbi:MAG: hypothetical protein QHJ73_16005 [Armatimonadota bacterium]|nr:hypothetical protein [Armatimonadota bacterium]
MRVQRSVFAAAVLCLAVAGVAAAAPADPGHKGIAAERTRRQALLKERMDPALLSLPDRLSKEGKGGNLKTGGLEVKNGYVWVVVELAKPSQSVVTRLKQLGFLPAPENKNPVKLKGKVPVAKLKEIAITEGVKKVSLPGPG